MIDEVLPRRLPRLASDTLAYGIGSAATATVSIIAVPIMTRLLDLASYGTLDLLATLLSILTVLTQLGLTSALVFFYRHAERRAERAEVASSALAIMTAASVGVGVVGAGVFAGASNLLGQPVSVGITGALTFLWVPVNVMGSGALDLLRAQFRARAFAALSVARAGAATLLGVLLVARADLDIAGVIGAQVIVGAGFGIATLVLVRADLGWPIRRPTALRVLHFGLPLVPAGIAAWVIVFSNRYFLLEYRSLEEVGIFAVAARVAAVMTIATVAVNAAWVPYAVQEAHRAGHREVFSRNVAVIAAGLFVVAMGLGLFAPEVLLIAAPPAYADAANYVGFLALGTAMSAIAGLVAIGLQLAQRTVAVATAAGIAAAANIGLNLVLIPSLGMLGAAVATLSTLTLLAALTLLFAQRRYPIPYPVPFLAATFGLAFGAIIIGLMIDLTARDSLVAFVARVGLFAAAAALIAVLSRGAVRSISGADEAGSTAAP